MSTRSFIARHINNKKGYEGVYCHWDGYPSYNGKILLDNYRHEKKLTKLLSHGDMSTLGSRIGTKHSFDQRPDGTTTYYGRDRGETNCSRYESLTLDDILKRAEQLGCEYFYLFGDGGWKFASRGMQFFGESDGTKFSRLKILKPEDCKDQEG